MDLSPFFAETDNVQYTTVYEDDLFIRTKAAVRISPDMAMTVVKDVHVNESVSLYSFSIAIEKEVSDPLTFTIGRDIEMLSQHNYALLAKKDDIICMPGKPVQREYNIDGNILCDSEHQIDSQFQCTKNTLTMELDCVESSFVTFQYIIRE